jgi:hypothetical protein
MKIYREIVTSLIALTMVGCAQIAVVSEKHPGALPLGSDRTRVAAQSIERGLAEENKEPIAALGEYVAAVRQSLGELKRNPRNAEAMRSYNFAIARIFGVIRDAKLDPWTHPLQVGAKGEFTLTWKGDPRPEWNLALYELIPADELTIKGTYVEKRVTKDGIGAPLVAKRILSDEQAAKLFIAPGIFYSITATAQFDGSRCVISPQDPLAVDSVQIDGHSYPLAADFTSSYALLLAQEKPQKLGLVRLLQPEKYASTFRLARMEPYDPDKTVLLVIHGLMDTPVTWVPMLNELRSDPFIRHNYQFWFYSYPSGYPYFYSALILRQELDGMEKRFLLRKKMVVVGHRYRGQTLARGVREIARSNRFPARDESPPRGGTHLQASPGNRPCRFHVRSSSRRGPRQELGRPDGINADQNAAPPRLGRSRRDARPCPGSSSPSVEAGSEQRRHSGSK